jgi:hypothetical protein
MASRFFLTNAGAAPVTPAFDGGWEQTGQADRVLLLPTRQTVTLQALADGTAITVPITTTQDLLCRQFVSGPLPPQNLFGTIGLVIRVFENAVSNNVTLAVVAKIVSQDGQTVRGTIFSTFNADTEFPLTASAATRIINNSALTPLVTQPGDRLVIEVGGHGAAPTAAGSYTMRFGNNAASDFALTSALTTDLNPWVELSSDLFGSPLNNYQFLKVGTGMSVSEKIR